MIHLRNITYLFKWPRVKYLIVLLIFFVLISQISFQEQKITQLPDPFSYYNVFYSQASNQDDQYPDSDGKISYEDEKFLQRAALRVGPGEHGYPVNINQDETARAQESMHWHGYYSYVSEKIPLFRSLPDFRHEKCKTIKYIKDLPKVSIIIPFFEEHHHTLKRTIVSILNTAPSRLIEEILLVDDGTTENKLDLQPFQDWIDYTFPSHTIKIFRNTEREGLIRARQVGADAAKSDILVFLDCHVEPLHNWLAPLIEPIYLDYKTVTCPFIDSIDMKTFEYRRQDDGARGMFDWNLDYKRRDLFKKDIQNMPDPFESPVMAGGLFAISKKWFQELGGYDLGMYIWGGEQYEISFKIWMCHGKMIDIPCSRIGHIYRKAMPYKNPKPGAISVNLKRLVETLMGGYEKYVYARRPSLVEVDSGNLEDRKLILSKLKCNSFEWFMKEVAPDLILYYPVVDPIPFSKGQISSSNDPNKCISNVNDKAILTNCPGTEISHTFLNELRNGNIDQGAIFYECHGGRGNQEFEFVKSAKYGEKISYKITGFTKTLCLTANFAKEFPSFIPCSKDEKNQDWFIEGINGEAAFEHWNTNNINYVKEKFDL